MLRSVILAFVVLFLSCAAAAEHLPVKTYTSADGLGSSFVDFLMRDSRGFMWFCTRDGLSRFDGSRFITYEIGNQASPPGIESIYQTRDGAYWISTTGGSYRFDLNEITTPNAAKPQINAEFVTAGRGMFFEDSKGDLYLTTGVLSRVERKDGKYVLTPLDFDIPKKTDALLVVNDMDETPDGSLWFNTNAGVIRRLPDLRLVYYPIDAFLTYGNSSMLADKSGRIWVSAGNRLLVIKPEPPEALSGGDEKVIVKSIVPSEIVNLRAKESFSLPKSSGEIVQFTSDEISNFVESSYSKRIFQTSNGDVWISAEDKLMQFSGNTFELHTRSEGLPNVMGRMAEDSAGNLWIGGHAGLARLDRHGLVTYGVEDGAKSTRFFAINEDAAGTIYVVGRDFYVNRFDGEKFESAQPVIDPESQYLWISRFGLRTSNGDWWILTNKKLYRFAGVSEFSKLDKLKPTQTFTSADGLKSDGMFQIFEDAEGSIWVSTRGRGTAGNGVARLKKGENVFRPFTPADGLPEGKSATSFVADNFGNIWLGFYEGGLARFDGAKFDFFDEKSGFPGGVITDLHIDEKGRLWIGSAIGGLLRLDDPSAPVPSFHHLTIADGLRSNNVRTVTEDRFGRIYIGTASGVDRISPDTGRVKHYSVNDGLAADFVVDSHCDKNGNLWFATNDGLSRLVPIPDERAAAPSIFIGGLRIASVEQPISQLGNQEIDKNELTYTENNFQIDFFGLDFRAGETLRYQYKLEGADADWSAPTESRTVTFANLQPAEYRFLVRAVNSEGIASEVPAVVSFKILPPIWARWWFVLLCAIAVTGVILLLYRYRIANLSAINAALSEAKLAEENLRKSKEERLAELEKVRSRIATDLHDDIGASLTQIAVLSEVAQAQSKGKLSATKESLSRISNVSNELVEAMSDIVWSINPQKDHLSDLTQRMRRFAADVLASRGIAFNFNAPSAADEIVVNTNLRREVFLLFKESVNNIVKHSDARHVRIDLKIAGGSLTLAIADDGRGFILPTNGNGVLPSDDYGGNGILSMKKRAAEMGGRVEINSRPDNGTTVSLSLPII